MEADDLLWQPVNVTADRKKYNAGYCKMIFYVFYMFSMVLDERGHKFKQASQADKVITVPVHITGCQGYYPSTPPSGKSIWILFVAAHLQVALQNTSTVAPLFILFLSFSDLTALMWQPQGLLQIKITNNLYSNDPDCGVFVCLCAYFHIHYVVQKPGEENVHWDRFFVFFLNQDTTK